MKDTINTISINSIHSISVIPPKLVTPNETQTYYDGKIKYYSMQSMYQNTHPPNQNTTLFLFTNCTIEFFDHKNVNFVWKWTHFITKIFQIHTHQCIVISYKCVFLVHWYWTGSHTLLIRGPLTIHLYAEYKLHTTYTTTPSWQLFNSHWTHRFSFPISKSTAIDTGSAAWSPELQWCRVISDSTCR